MPGSGESRIAERRPLLLAPVPGESAWVAAQRDVTARASLAALQAGGRGSAAAAKRHRDEGGAGQDDDVSVSMLVSDATGQTATDDGDSATSRARRAATADQQHGQQQEASSGAPMHARADLPTGCCMAYVSSRRLQGPACVCLALCCRRRPCARIVSD